MKPGWEKKILGDVLQKTETITPQHNPHKEFQYIDVSSIDNKRFVIENTTLTKGINAPSRARRLVKKGDVIFATVRPTLRRIAIIPEKYDNQVCSTGYFVLRGKENINNRLLFYFLLTSSFQSNMELLQKGTSYPAVTNGDIKNQVIAFPKSINEQERIVAILDEAFDAIDRAKENAEQNLRNARELFESVLEGVFANPGDGWERKKLEDICENLDSKRIPVTKRDRKAGIYPYYGASGIVDYVDNYIFDEDLLLVSEDGANLLARTYPIAFSIKGKAWVNNHAHVLRFEIIDTQKFVEYFLNSIKLDDYVSGMAQPKLNQKMLNSIIIPLPELGVQKDIVNKFEELSSETQKLEKVYQQKLNDFEELKQSILHKAFEGGLTAG